MKTIQEIFEAYIGQAQPTSDKKPVKYIGPDGKTKIKMIATKRDVREYYEDEMASPEELGMAMSQLRFIQYAADEIEEHLDAGADFPEWFQNKLTSAYNEIQGLYSYMAGENYEDEDDADEDEDE